MVSIPAWMKAPKTTKEANAVNEKDDLVANLKEKVKQLV